jgi:hypothetical protein
MIPSIKILTSAIGYGTYFPALLVKKNFERMGMAAEILLFERLYNTEKKKLFRDTAEAFATNFKLAQLANKVPVDYRASTDESQVNARYADWSKETSIHFVCFSGLWFEILKDFRPASTQIKISCCRMDAGHAHTWVNHSRLAIDDVYYFFDMAKQQINYRFEIPAFSCRPYMERDNSILIHGGGWALGDFIASTTGLVAKGYHRNIIIRNSEDFDAEEAGTTFFMNDPLWDMVGNADQKESFPAIGKMTTANMIDYANQDHYHPILDLVNTGKAMVSKPGGMTFADALITCTPIFYLEPLGENEMGNSVIIETLKIGMSFKKWEREGFDPRYLTLFHENLKRLKRETPDFVAAYIEKNSFS